MPSKDAKTTGCFCGLPFVRLSMHLNRKIECAAAYEAAAAQFKTFQRNPNNLDSSQLQHDHPNMDDASASSPLSDDDIIHDMEDSDTESTVHCIHNMFETEYHDFKK